MLVDVGPAGVTSRVRARGFTPAQEQIWQTVQVCAAVCPGGVFSTGDVWEQLVSSGFGWSRWMAQELLARWAGFGGIVPDSAPPLLRRVRHALLRDGPVV